MAAAADVRLGGIDGDRRRDGDQVTGLVIEPDGVAGPDPYLAREDERLGTRAGLGETTIDDELVESDASGLRAGRRVGGRGCVHPPIVPRADALGLIRLID